MVNKKLWLGMLVIVLVFGMLVVSCDDGSGNFDLPPPVAVDLGPYPNEVEMSHTGVLRADETSFFQGYFVQAESSLVGRLIITFSPVTRPPPGVSGVFSGSPASVGVADFNWFNTNTVSLTHRFIGQENQHRTISITGVEIRQSGINVEVILTLNRSHLPPPPPSGFHTFITTDFSFALPTAFESRFDEVSWRGASRNFMW